MRFYEFSELALQKLKAFKHKTFIIGCFYIGNLVVVGKETER
jgi:hypothetical protein